MKKIVRLTERDLSRIVKRIINEESTSSDQQKYDTLYDAVSGLGTNSEQFFNVLKSIKDKAEYDRINKIAAKNGEDIPELFTSEYEFSTKEYKHKFCDTLRSKGINDLSVKLNGYETCSNYRHVSVGVTR